MSVEILPTEPYYATLNPLYDNDWRVRAAFDMAGQKANELGESVYVVLAGVVIGGALPR
jgi:hypothetical protein